MAGAAKNREKGAQGGIIVFDAFFKQNGNLVNSDFLPTVEIKKPDTTTEATGTATLISTGTYNFTWSVPVDAVVSDQWTITWTGAVSSVPVINTEFFEVVAAGEIGFGDDITIEDKWLSQVKKVLAFPVVDQFLLTDDQIKDLCVRHSLHDYFTKFPLKKREQVAISQSLEIDFPDFSAEGKSVYGVLDMRVVEKFGNTNSSSFLDIVRFQQLTGNNYGRVGGDYRTRYSFNGSRQAWFAKKQELDTFTNDGTFKYFVNHEDQKVEAYSSVSAELKITWACESFDFSSVKRVYQFDVVQLAQSYLLRHLSDTMQIYQDNSIDQEIDADALKERGQELYDRVMTKWIEIPDIIAIRGA